jgi:hypothetical protein
VTQGEHRQHDLLGGWTETVRPDECYTEALKIKGSRMSDYEEDHLIPLELGGSLSSPRNLWPEFDSGIIPNPKDSVEDVSVQPAKLGDPIVGDLGLAVPLAPGRAVEAESQRGRPRCTVMATTSTRIRAAMRCTSTPSLQVKS